MLAQVVVVVSQALVPSTADGARPADITLNSKVPRPAVARARAVVALIHDWAPPVLVQALSVSFHDPPHLRDERVQSLKRVALLRSGIACNSGTPQARRTRINIYLDLLHFHPKWQAPRGSACPCRWSANPLAARSHVQIRWGHPCWVPYGVPERADETRYEPVHICRSLRGPRPGVDRAYRDPLHVPRRQTPRLTRLWGHVVPGLRGHIRRPLHHMQHMAVFDSRLLQGLVILREDSAAKQYPLPVHLYARDPLNLELQIPYGGSTPYAEVVFRGDHGLDFDVKQRVRGQGRGRLLLHLLHPVQSLLLELCPFAFHLVRSLSERLPDDP
mmetsp:Transcript_11677/g.32340  ORF Transcript_11677/g.32340 Transcript_11677/m.32340 type:complete len:330 (-) Transcript_11677:62-1051(-)